MESQKLNFILEFIQEVADFKSFVKGYIRDDPTKFIGLRDMHHLKFYVDDEGWPVMRYKESTVGPHWLPCNKPHVCLWKADSNNRPRIPRGIPNLVPFRRVWRDEIPSPIGNRKKGLEKENKATKKKSLIKTGICGYISF